MGLGRRGWRALATAAAVSVAGAATLSSRDEPVTFAQRAAWVSERPDARSRQVGWIARGGRPRMLEAAPPADAGGWVAIEGGFVPSWALSTSADAGRDEAALRFAYGKVVRAGAPRFARPEPDAGQLGGEQLGHVLALLRDPALADAGWAERPHGGFIRLRDLRLEHPSDFEGEHRPGPITAFVARTTRPLGAPADAGVLRRFDRFQAESYDAREVRAGDLRVRRADVRLALALPRPAGVPAGARWVRVDLREQTLTAFEGDLPVFATLVSTGKPESPTHPGLFTVWFKGIHERMHSADEYDVEEVPDVMYFHRGEGLHGAFWHQQFGAPASHGCVNLSVADARWLFEWAPPALPDGWHSRLPGPDEDSLRVWIDGPTRPAPSAPDAGTPMPTASR